MKMRSGWLRACGAGAVSLWLAACGGGGGGGGATLPDGAGASSSSSSSSVASVTPGAWGVIGSSSAAGAGALAGQGWAALLQADYSGSQVTIRNLAVGGTVSYQGLPTGSSSMAGRPAPEPAANVTAALAAKPRLLLVSYPTNDTALGYAVSETVANLHAIRAAALAEGVPVILLSTQPRDLSSGLLARLVQIDEQLAALAGRCFVPVREALAGPDGKLSATYDAGDGVHPNAAGHVLIRDKIKAVIDSGACVKAG
ncbi:MAG: SGNH/GDSL hydrolase family protein [Candidatus Dactylopiibacterium sp.]|nr:SGNH/GDSL hydrolase family protein [Candidatus Dactylopiibacterium sp.]